jgi:hypothetical protein
LPLASNLNADLATDQIEPAVVAVDTSRSKIAVSSFLCTHEIDALQRIRRRVLNRVFFAIVALQKHIAVGRARFRRDATAGYP